MEKTDREGENVMQALFDAVNAICGKIQVVSDLFWEFPTNFGWYAAIPILGNFSLAIILLVGTGIFLTFRFRFVQVRKFKYGLKVLLHSKVATKTGISALAAFLLSTAMRVGPGNILGVTGAISIGGPGALFWMWLSAALGASTAFVEAALAQLYKEKDPLYGGYHGGPAYYIHSYAERVRKKKLKRSVIAVLFALSGLICWGGISQVISNSVASSFENAFGISPFVTTVVLVVISAVIVMRKNATVRALDVIVPIMAGCYFVITLFIIATHLSSVPGVFARIFAEAFGLRQIAAGGFGAVLMNGVKRGLFSNEAGSGSAPCAAAAAEESDPVQVGLVQALGVFIDTIVICSCTAMIMLLVPEELMLGLVGMDLLQKVMSYYMGEFGVVFIAVTLALFSFSTFLGILFYARSNVAYLFGNRWIYQTLYKIFALIMLFVGGLQAYTVVWDLGDVGVGLMTVFNLIVLFPLSGEALRALKEYEEKKTNK